MTWVALRSIPVLIVGEMLIPAKQKTATCIQYIIVMPFNCTCLSLGIVMSGGGCTVTMVARQIGGIIIWGNCAFDDTSMSFGTLLEHILRNIFGYRAIAYIYPMATMAAIFQNGRHRFLFYQQYSSGSRPHRILILMANRTFTRMRNAVVLFTTC